MVNILGALARDLKLLIIYVVRLLYSASPLLKVVLIFTAAFAGAWLAVSHIFLSVCKEEECEDDTAKRHNDPGPLCRIEKRLALWSLSVSFRVFRDIYEWCREVLEDEKGMR